MKRMVKNGDLIDVEPDGSITIAGKPVGGGGSDYTAGSNIQISEAKEISVKSDITGINSVRFGGTNSPTIGDYENSGIKIKSNSSSHDYAPIYLFRYGYNEVNNRSLCFLCSSDNNSDQRIYIDHRGETGPVFAFLTRGTKKVPFVPSADGTYVLKATVTGASVEYTWEKEA